MKTEDINNEFDDFQDYLSRKEKNLKLLTNINLDFDDDFDFKF